MILHDGHDEWHEDRGAEQRGCRSGERDPKLIWFDRVVKVEAQSNSSLPTSKFRSSTSKMSSSCIRVCFWTLFICMERKFDRASNGTSPT